ncbi:hypothetical protein PC116_g1742 [Phytophthora cactorum]|uniref:Uncharacterized protein n=1 Tax=Phytophthora cactorum TaxID=29920 RepID=A0A8T1EKL0_9STRA|nr:hypothetical protein PC114_g654 [Phytophthora cactorum]KAG2955231.1 hypothetical protein PC117_g584 [Phytophthora cactorum]KAG3034468.1 hypothetical protein PC120_g1484 [Phytophthora cactorum]KAG4250520.1 hypothetical protein PC116_g1742 [Phytophthora cactorum]
MLEKGQALAPSRGPAAAAWRYNFALGKVKTWKCDPARLYQVPVWAASLGS